jgi:hypothetical protein
MGNSEFEEYEAKLRLIFFSIIRIYIGYYLSDPFMFENEIARICYKYYEYCSVLDQSSK